MNYRTIRKHRAQMVEYVLDRWRRGHPPYGRIGQRELDRVADEITSYTSGNRIITTTVDSAGRQKAPVRVCKFTARRV